MNGTYVKKQFVGLLELGDQALIRLAERCGVAWERVAARFARSG